MRPAKEVLISTLQKAEKKGKVIGITGVEYVLEAMKVFAREACEEQKRLVYEQLDSLETPLYRGQLENACLQTKLPENL